MSVLNKLSLRAKRAYSRIAPIDKSKIVFDNIAGKGYGENLKYIAEEIKKRDLKVKMYWLVSDMDTILPSWMNRIQIGTLRAEYELQTAGFVVYNYRRRWEFPKKKGQVFLQTWHGGIAMKKIEKDAEDKLPESYIKNAVLDGQLTDGIIADGEQIEDIYKRAFWLNDNCEMLRFGSPRIDVLLNSKNTNLIRKRVRGILQIKDNAYVVLYAPTFRNSGTAEAYVADLDAVKRAFSITRSEIVILVRLHPNVAKTSHNLKYDFSDTIINATDYYDPQELIIASDACITDYSSIVYDFAMMGKPGFLCMKDLDAYIAERGMYDWFYDQPFNMNYDEESLCQDISTFDYDEYKKKLDTFFEKYKTYNLGNAAAQTVDWLVERGLSEKRRKA